MATNIYSQGDVIQYGIKKYVVDTAEEMAALPTGDRMGCKCYVIGEQKWYILDGNKEWQEYPFGSNGGGQPATDKVDVDQGIENAGKFLGVNAEGMVEPEDMPDAIVTATGNMTSEQVGQVLENIEAEPEVFNVYITHSGIGAGTTYSADKTYTETNDAFTEGKKVAFFVDGEFFGFAKSDGPRIYSSVFRRSVMSTFIYSNYYGVVFESINVESAADEVTDTTSTSITLTLAVDNTIYTYGELTDLTVTAIPATGNFIIRFISGATATTTNFPVDMLFPEAFAAEANTRYEINVSDGYALVAGWPTT